MKKVSPLREKYSEFFNVLHYVTKLWKYFADDSNTFVAIYISSNHRAMEIYGLQRCCVCVLHILQC